MREQPFNGIKCTRCGYRLIYACRDCPERRKWVAPKACLKCLRTGNPDIQHIRTKIQPYLCTDCQKAIKEQDEFYFKYVDLKNCAMGRGSGVCDILRKHHELMKDDDQRMTTEFLVNMTCGKEGLRKYRKAKKRKNNGLQV